MNKSFTLIELLVVIVIIGILAGVITLSVSSNIAKAQDTKISASILSLNKILKTESILSFPIETTPCNLKDSCTNLKSKIDIPKIEDDIYYITSTSGDFFSLSAQKKSDTSLGFKITSDTESVSDAVFDTRDNNSYRVVTIGNQIWMAENLAYLPSVVGPATGSGTVAYYYVYDYNGTNVNDAKVTYNYKTHGVLYNYYASLDACPTGWSLPTDDEWKTLEMFLGMSQTEVDKIDWRGTDEGAKLKTGGSSGFNALMSGTRFSGYFDAINATVNFRIIDVPSLYNMRRWMTLSESRISRVAVGKDLGIVVRCVKD